MATQVQVATRGQALGLGIDAGGTLTRWALARANGDIVAEGQVGGLSALQLASPAGRQAVFHSFSVLCRDVLAAGRPVRVRAGLTGFGGDGVQLGAWLAQLLALEPDARKHVLRLTAEVKNSDDMIGYIELLKQQEFFSAVTLTRHEVSELDPNRPLRFQLDAEWRAP